MTAATAISLLLVDDDPRLGGLLKQYLESQGFHLDVAGTGLAMDALLVKKRPDLLILDWMLPGESGIAICQRLRNAGQSFPILMLTAKGDAEDRIRGLETGADDYLPKPFNPRELVARIHAILRRQARQPLNAASPPLHFGDFTLDLEKRQLARHGVPVDLTTSEFELLQVLATHPNRQLSRQQLLDLAKDPDCDAFDRSIDVRISRLRKIIEAPGEKPRFIRTVWGYGYLFSPEGNL